MTGMIGLSALTGGPWPMIAGAAALTLVVSGGTYWVTSRGYQTEISQLKLAQQTQITQASQKALDQFTSDWNLIHSAAQNYQATQASLGEKFSDLQKALAQATAIPLGADCTATAGRMSVLKAAVLAVNNAIAGLEPRSAMPANSSTTGPNIRRTAPVGH